MKKIISVLLVLMIMPCSISANTYADYVNNQTTMIGCNQEAIFIPCDNDVVENQNTQDHEPVSTYVQYFTDTDVMMGAKLLYNEDRGVSNKNELACHLWCALNRVDAGWYGGTFFGVVTAKNQFAYSYNTPVWDDLLALSYDVFERWNNEKNGYTDVGRVLPNNYYWYSGNGHHNYFYCQYDSRRNRPCGQKWDYSLPSPY